MDLCNSFNYQILSPLLFSKSNYTIAKYYNLALVLGQNDPILIVKSIFKLIFFSNLKMAVGEHGVILVHVHQRAVDHVHGFEPGTAQTQLLARAVSTVLVNQQTNNLVTWQYAKTEVNCYK